MNNTLLTIDHSTALNQICSCVCQAIIVIQEQDPELLLERYRNLQWRDSRYQSSLTAKLTEQLSDTQDWDALVQQLQRFLQALLIPESSNSPKLIELLKKIRQLNPAKPELNGLGIPKHIEWAEKQMISVEPELNSSDRPSVELLNKVTLNGSVVSLHGQGIRKMLKNLDLSGNFPSFLRSCSSFQLQKTGDSWQVALQPTTN